MDPLTVMAMIKTGVDIYNGIKGDKSGESSGSSGGSQMPAFMSNGQGSYGPDSTKELIKYQHELNMQDWYEQQKYNSPKEQLKRLTEAGVNPATVLSGGSIENTTGMPNPTDVAGLSNAAVNKAMLNQELALREAQVHDLESGAKLKDAQAANTEKQTERYDEFIDAQLELFGSEASANDARAVYEEALAALSEEQKKLVVQNTINAAAELNNIRLTGKEIKSRISLNNEEVNCKQKLQELYGKQSGYYENLSKEAYASYQKIIEETSSIKQKRIFDAFVFPAEMQIAYNKAKQSGDEAAMAQIQREVMQRTAMINALLETLGKGADVAMKFYELTNAPIDKNVDRFSKLTGSGGPNPLAYGYWNQK